MRLAIDSLIALMLVAVLSGILLSHRQHTEQAVSVQGVQAALSELQTRTILHGALGETDVNEMGHPTQVSAMWFERGAPVNDLVPPEQPWIDFAPSGDFGHHPPDPVITKPTQAGFWYNPASGVFRARVLPQLSDAATLELYNKVNHASLDSLERDDRPHRQPIPHVGQLPVRPTETIAGPTLPDSGATVTINPLATAASLLDTTSTRTDADPQSPTDDPAASKRDQPVATDAFGRPIQLDCNVGKQ